MYTQKRLFLFFTSLNYLFRHIYRYPTSTLYHFPTLSPLNQLLTSDRVFEVALTIVYSIKRRNETILKHRTLSFSIETWKWTRCRSVNKIKIRKNFRRRREQKKALFRETNCYESKGARGRALSTGSKRSFFQIIEAVCVAAASSINPLIRAGIFFSSLPLEPSRRERLLELVQKIGDKACGVGARRVWVVGAVAAAVAAESPQGTKGGWTWPVTRDTTRPRITFDERPIFYAWPRFTEDHRSGKWECFHRFSIRPLLPSCRHSNNNETRGEELITSDRFRSKESNLHLSNLFPEYIFSNLFFSLHKWDLESKTSSFRVTNKW